MKRYHHSCLQIRKLRSERLSKELQFTQLYEGGISSGQLHLCFMPSLQNTHCHSSPYLERHLSWYRGKSNVTSSKLILKASAQKRHHTITHAYNFTGQINLYRQECHQRLRDNIILLQKIT